MDKKELLKNILKRIHQGEELERIKTEFKTFLERVNEAEIVEAEEELIKEGISREEIQRLCSIHLQLFKEGLKSEGEQIAPEGHPLYILMEEHKILLGFAKEIEELAVKTIEEKVERLEYIIQHLKDSESHYLREENVLFPILEKHGVTQPPAIMWMEHNQIREIKKKIMVRLAILS